MVSFRQSELVSLQQRHPNGHLAGPDLAMADARRPIEFRQLQHCNIRGVDAFVVDYRTRQPLRLSFNNQNCLHLHLRLRGTGRYAINNSAIIHGHNSEMQVYCFPHAWSKDVYEDGEVDARSILLGVPRERADAFLGPKSSRVYSSTIDAGGHQRIGIPAALADEINRIFELEGDGIDGLRREAQLLEVLASSLVLAERGDEEQLCRRLHPRDRSRIRQVEDYIQSNLAAALLAPDLAKSAGMSLGKFKRVFCEVTGKTIGDFIRTARLKKAADMLMQSYSVVEAANGVGFSHGGHFARIFREAYQMTPHEFRDDHAVTARRDT